MEDPDADVFAKLELVKKKVGIHRVPNLVIAVDQVLKGGKVISSCFSFPPCPGYVPWSDWASEIDLEWTALTNQTAFSGQGCPVPDAPLLTRGGFGAGMGACLHLGGHGGGVNSKRL